MFLLFIVSEENLTIVCEYTSAKDFYVAFVFVHCVSHLG